MLVGVKLRDDGLDICRAVCRLGVHLVEWLGRHGSESELGPAAILPPKTRKRADFWFGGIEVEFGTGVLTYAMGSWTP